METKMAVGDRLKALRGNESVQNFADRLGVHPNTIRRYEAGERDPDTAFLLRLWSLLRVRPDWVVTGEGEMFAPAARALSASPEEDGQELSERQKAALHFCTVLLRSEKLHKSYRVASLSDSRELTLTPTERRLLQGFHAASAAKKRLLMELAEEEIRGPED